VSARHAAWHVPKLQTSREALLLAPALLLALALALGCSRRRSSTAPR